MPIHGTNLTPPSKDTGNIRILFNNELNIPDWPDKSLSCNIGGDITVIATNLTERHLAALMTWMSVPFKCVHNADDSISWPFGTVPNTTDLSKDNVCDLKTMAELFMSLFGFFTTGGVTGR
jgi:hypothetical protein